MFESLIDKGFKFMKTFGLRGLGITKKNKNVRGTPKLERPTSATLRQLTRILDMVLGVTGKAC